MVISMVVPLGGPNARDPPLSTSLKQTKYHVGLLGQLVLQTLTFFINNTLHFIDMTKHFNLPFYFSSCPTDH